MSDFGIHHRDFDNYYYPNPDLLLFVTPYCHGLIAIYPNP